MAKRLFILIFIFNSALFGGNSVSRGGSTLAVEGRLLPSHWYHWFASNDEEEQYEPEIKWEAMTDEQKRNFLTTYMLCPLSILDDLLRKWAGVIGGIPRVEAPGSVILSTVDSVHHKSCEGGRRFDEDCFIEFLGGILVSFNEGIR